MAGKASEMMYRSRVPSLLGRKQHQENRIITAAELVEATGASPNTVKMWLDSQHEFANLNAGIAWGFMQYFGVTLNDLVEIVPKSNAA